MAEFSAVKKPLVGIFAIQGAVEEHADLVRKCGGDVKEVSKLHSRLAPHSPSVWMLEMPRDKQRGIYDTLLTDELFDECCWHSITSSYIDSTDQTPRALRRPWWNNLTWRGKFVLCLNATAPLLLRQRRLSINSGSISYWSNVLPTLDLHATSFLPLNLASSIYRRAQRWPSLGNVGVFSLS